MAVKIYAKGNFFFVETASNVIFFDNIESSAVIKNTSTSTSYSVLFKSANNIIPDVAFSDIRDEAGLAYASQSVFETYAYENTGVRVADVGLGTTDLSYTASPTNGVVTSSTGTDATIPLADGTNAGLLTPDEKTKLSNTSGTNTGDQTSIIGITGTKAQFDTSCTDGDFAYQSDLSSKQDTLVSTTNIKSVNGTTLLGSGNLAVGDALVANPLSQFASTTSAQLAGVISDETGTGNLVFSASPTFTGSPIAPTQSASDNSTKIATTAYVDSAITSSSGFIPKIEANEVFRGVEYRNGSTTEDTYGGITMTNDATAITKTIANTTFLTKKIRKGFSHTVVSTGHMMDMRVASSMYYVGTGFRFVISFGIPDTVYASGCRQFHGMQSSTSAPVYSDTTQVDTMTNIIGVGSESADTNLQIFHNDASGTATKVDLGDSFPANRNAGGELTTMYSIELYNAVNGTTVLYSVVNGETGAVSTGTLSTNLPLSSQSLTFVSSRCMGGGGGNTNTGRLDLGRLGCYSLY
jgi:hypothetical protein